MNIPRKRSGSGSSKKTKEKYEILFKNEESEENLNETVLNEIINTSSSIALEAFEQEISKVNFEQASVIRRNINQLLKLCINNCMRDEGDAGGVQKSKKLVICSLRVLCICFYLLLKKQQNLVQKIVSDDDLRALFDNLHKILLNDSIEAQDICLKFLLIVLTGCDNLNENSLIEFLMQENGKFDALIQLVQLHNAENTSKANDMGNDVVLILVLLANYRKNECTNPYIVQLSIFADESALNSFGKIINNKLVEFSRQYASARQYNESTSSWLTSLSSLRNIFISDDDNDKTSTIRANNVQLLALYENIHLNRNFITTLAHTQNESSPPSPSNTLQNQQASATDLASGNFQDVLPTNLFVSIFEYCSIVMKDYARSESIVNTKLCFIILTCISEDSYANSLMHDENLNFKVQIHRAQMRLRKLPKEKISQPLASTLFDLIIEFIVSHMSKQKFPMELYMLSIGIIHRLIVYQKRCCVRLNYNWKTLWAAMINLLKFLVYQEQYLIKKYNIFLLATQIINIFNFFISFGDTFLKTTQMYDELYYELNREEKIFSEIHAFVLRYSAMTDTEYKDDVLKTVNSLTNILTIIKHFQIKIKEWLAERSLTTPSEEQILSVVRENYDLTLKMIENLDAYERYNEQKHSAFFMSIVTDVIGDLKLKNCAKFLSDVNHL